ncbi:MAG: TfoX/Sxy family DNA transformation protein [Pseudomonadota bacterium]
MTRPVRAIRNIGPAMEEAFHGVGITSAEEIEEMGVDAAYQKLLAGGHRPHFIAYYALVMGLQGRPWNDLGADEKASLRKRFDALKHVSAPQSAFEREMDALGLKPQS